MKGFERNDQLLSLCGPNCRLCPMFLGKYCPGCGGGDGNQGCRIASCGMEHGKEKVGTPSKWNTFYYLPARS